MLTAGLDIGSRTIALVEWDGAQIVRREVVFTGTDPLKKSRQLLAERHYDNLVPPATAVIWLLSTNWQVQ